MRRTICNSISCSGIGGFTGHSINVTLKPAPVNSGISFFRKDLGISIPADYHYLRPVPVNTCVTKDGAEVFVIEHILSALWCFNITDIVIELDGPEMPLLDGSARYFIFMINSVGVHNYDVALPVLNIDKVVRVDGNNDSYIAVEACDRLVIDYTIDYPEKTIGMNRFIFDSGSMSFSEDIALARTFCTRKEISHRLEVAKGWSVCEALIFDDETIKAGENEVPLRYFNEPTRHKILDLIGDLMLSGYMIHGKFTCYKSGHKLNHEVIRAILGK